jgi:hypothetical protein
LRKLPKRRKKISGKKTKKKPPSIQFGKFYSKYLAQECEADAQVVLGCYFDLYRGLFGEEDPEWAGKSCVKPLYNINQMTHSVCDGEYEQLVEFLETIMPLWAKELKKDLDFPSTRPSVDTLFVRRKIWAQRFNLYRRWKT